MPHLDYYDKLLFAIVGSLGLGAALGLATSIAFPAGLAGGALIVTLFVYDAMFRHPPIPTKSTRVRTAAIGWHAFVAVTIAAAVI
ncbi:hypothetical protein [Haloterrigena alkaliphila]|uniref:Uncharacterized protein n=1 Tax=Haloterrigena alkaliphila TaxID=2816475 RepID=A0A8A2VC30_9EURY|nr:hypothetical protein [Haloterrigena alkaliphila]QSW99593.1 hypothetical protein J0X25_01130 [Haloterrigena alkaliphila]